MLEELQEQELCVCLHRETGRDRLWLLSGDAIRWDLCVGWKSSSSAVSSFLHSHAPLHLSGWILELAVLKGGFNCAT